MEYLKTLIINYKLKDTGWELWNYTCTLCGRVVGKRIAVTHDSVCTRINTLKKQQEDTEVPIQVITIKGERYYRYGDSGKPYKNRSDAEKQAQAIHAAGYKEPKKDMSKK